MVWWRTKRWKARNAYHTSSEKNVAPDHDGKAAPYGSGYDEINEDPNETKGGLGKWFRQKWVDVSRKKKGGGHPACGASAGKKSRKGGKRAYPKCVPASKARSMSKKEKESASRRKRSAYKEKVKPGKKPKNISTEVLMNAKQKIQEINRLLEKSIPTDKQKWSYAKNFVLTNNLKVIFLYAKCRLILYIF